MMYLPALGHGVFCERLTGGLYRVVVGDVYTVCPGCMVDEAFAVLIDDEDTP